MGNLKWRIQTHVLNYKNKKKKNHNLKIVPTQLEKITIAPNLPYNAPEQANNKPQQKIR